MGWREKSQQQGDQQIADRQHQRPVHHLPNDLQDLANLVSLDESAQAQATQLVENEPRTIGDTTLQMLVQPALQAQPEDVEGQDQRGQRRSLQPP